MNCSNMIGGAEIFFEPGKILDVQGHEVIRFFIVVTGIVALENFFIVIGKPAGNVAEITIIAGPLSTTAAVSCRYSAQLC